MSEHEASKSLCIPKMHSLLISHAFDEIDEIDEIDEVGEEDTPDDDDPNFTPIQ